MSVTGLWIACKMLEKIGPDHEIDLFALKQPLHLGHGAVRLEFVVDGDDLDLAAGHLAAEILDPERKTIADLRAERRRRPGQGHDHADLDFFLRVAGRQPTLNRSASPANFNCCFMFFPDRRPRAAEAQAYSDDGVGRKQRSGIEASTQRMQGSRQLFEIKEFALAER